ncbi:MAG: 16S rRNA (guanine(966)-N(2))-methyltransferase RsmD [Candidatus Hydrogenedentes bacterium]|nr:16S rRNA (guanine(966)-N(2))-methyltransferase RsmD [Candidatus Hydrogenedentota bacterium]
MRVIAGKAKGIRLESPKGRGVRPTLDRVRESLFSILGPRLADARFLDLFAGTGANGIEALSRGAVHATFVDNDRRSQELVRRNLGRAGLSDSADCRCLRLPNALASLSPCEPYDIIFADPPYAFEEFDALLGALQEGRLLAEDGIVVVEHARGAAVPEQTAGLCRQREAVYGDTRLSFFT